MKYNYVLHITDDYLYLKKKDKIIQYRLAKDVIYGGKVANINKFMKYLEKLLSENHLNNSLFGEKIKIIVASNYTPADITFLKNIINITFLDEYKKVNNIYIETKCFLSNDDLMSYLNYILGEKEVYLLGSGNLINEIFSSFENKFNKKTYIFKNFETYIITSKKA